MKRDGSLIHSPAGGRMKLNGSLIHSPAEGRMELDESPIQPGRGLDGSLIHARPGAGWGWTGVRFSPAGV
ncbi:hypothetical protein SRB5_18230 [Streptomyces sp. RB5]|uniref:Uncharacterized protein n=1 Tax=Streptomyces smaragdinus TaxID=2585196 RepID=A0A7K0CG46_9ACTN|nr:hypothetical protein [Streptomyces smaragdinus]